MGSSSANSYAESNNNRSRRDAPYVHGSAVLLQSLIALTCADVTFKVGFFFKNIMRRAYFLPVSKNRKKFRIHTALEGAAVPPYVENRQNIRRDRKAAAVLRKVKSLAAKVLDGVKLPPQGVDPHQWRVLHMALAQLKYPTLLTLDSRTFVIRSTGATICLLDAIESETEWVTSVYTVDPPKSRCYCAGVGQVTIVEFDYLGRSIVLAVCTCRDWRYHGWFCVHCILAALRHFCLDGTAEVAASKLVSMVQHTDSFFHRTSVFPEEGATSDCELVPMACPDNKFGSSLRFASGTKAHPSEGEDGWGGGWGADLSDDDDRMGQGGADMDTSGGGAVGASLSPGDECAAQADVNVVTKLLEVVQESYHSRLSLRTTMAIAQKLSDLDLQRLGRLLAGIGVPSMGPGMQVVRSVQGDRTPHSYRHARRWDQPDSDDDSAPRDVAGHYDFGGNLGLTRFCTLIGYLRRASSKDPVPGLDFV